MTQPPAQRTSSYTITVSFLDDGQTMVQVEGDPYPLGMFKETGWDDERLLADARGAIINHWNSQVAAKTGEQPCSTCKGDMVVPDPDNPVVGNLCPDCTTASSRNEERP